MCLAVPGKVVSIEGENAVVDYGGLRRTANISFVECGVGDYVLVHVGFAIQKVDKKRALESYRLLSELDISKSGEKSNE